MKFLNSSEYLSKFKLAGVPYNNDDIIYLSGSIVEGKLSDISRGVGNKLSDVDVFILRNTSSIDEKHTYTINNRKFDFKLINNIHYDFETYDLTQIREIFNSIAQLDFSKNLNVKRQLNLPNGWTFTVLNSIIHRLLNSIPIQNEDALKELKDSLDYARYSKMYSQILKNRIDDANDDVIGNALNPSTQITSIYVLRQSFIYLIEIILLKEGITNDREKWAQLKFNNLSKKSSKYDSVKEWEKRIFFEEINVFESDTKKMIFEAQNFLNDEIEKLEE